MVSLCSLCLLLPWRQYHWLLPNCTTKQATFQRQAHGLLTDTMYVLHGNNSREKWYLWQVCKSIYLLSGQTVGPAPSVFPLQRKTEVGTHPKTTWGKYGEMCQSWGSAKNHKGRCDEQQKDLFSVYMRMWGLSSLTATTGGTFPCRRLQINHWYFLKHQSKVSWCKWSLICKQAAF